MVSITHILNKGDAAATDIADVLTHESPDVRCSGRLAATGAMERIVEWVDAERSRGTPIDMVLHTLFITQVHVAASIVASVLSPGADEPCLKNYGRVLAREFIEHCQRVRKFSARSGG